MDDTELGGYLEISGFPGRTVAVYGAAADSTSLGIPEFRKFLNGFAGNPIKIHKIFRESCGILVSLT